MCLAIVARDVHAAHALVVAANRDEFHARPAAPAAWWNEGWLAGRDLDAGGTWFGVTRRGRWALVTNVREPGRHDAAAPSRGALVPRLLDDDRPPLVALAALTDDAARYNGYNLLVGDALGAAWMSNRASSLRPQPLHPGVAGLSNALLDTPWPKLASTKAALVEWSASGESDIEPLFAALAERRRASDADLPTTGVPLERERMLSAPFIVSDAYGTRCSTILTITRDGKARLVERTFDASGAMTGEVSYRFAIEAGG